jgi:NitT/TauT family transport system permease protein
MITVVILLLWEYAAGRFVDELLISRPSAIWESFLGLLVDGRIVGAAMATLAVALGGLLWGTLIGVSAGLVMALNRRTYAILASVFDALFAVPKIALVPLFILWFGISAAQRTIFTASVVFFFVFYSTVNGAKRIPRALENVFQLLDASVYQRVKLLYLPASLGWVLGGMRIATPYAFVSAVSAEIIASRNGLGALVKASGAMLDVSGMFAGIVVATLLTIVSGAIATSVDERWRFRL